MQDLEEKLKEASDCRFRLISTDGVFSMDGIIANLKAICDLADKYKAIVMVDDCHAAGFLGKNGRGSHEYSDVIGRVDIITGTLEKPLAAHLVATLQEKKRLSNGCVSAQDLIFFPYNCPQV